MTVISSCRHTVAPPVPGPTHRAAVCAPAVPHPPLHDARVQHRVVHAEGVSGTPPTPLSPPSQAVAAVVCGETAPVRCALRVGVCVAGVVHGQVCVCRAVLVHGSVPGRERQT